MNKGAVVINTERCKGCALCVEACPKDVLALSDRRVNASGYHFVDTPHADRCIGCASCAIVCPDACIEVYRTKH